MLTFFADLPAQLQERVVCSVTAAIQYDIPANIVLAVAEKEGGRAGQWVKNTNGTYDVGSMQINTTYLKDLSAYGITANDVAAEGCYSYSLAAWRIRGHIINDKGDLWTKVANYHSRTPKFNKIYRADIIQIAEKWANWLDENYETIDVSSPQKNHEHKKIASPANESANGSLAEKNYTPRAISFN